MAHISDQTDLSFVPVVEELEVEREWVQISGHISCSSQVEECHLKIINMCFMIFQHLYDNFVIFLLIKSIQDMHTVYAMHTGLSYDNYNK